MDPILLKINIDKWFESCRRLKEFKDDLDNEEWTAIEFLTDFWRVHSLIDENSVKECNDMIDVLKQHDKYHANHREIITCSKDFRNIAKTMFTEDNALFVEFKGMAKSATKDCMRKRGKINAELKPVYTETKPVNNEHEVREENVPPNINDNNNNNINFADETHTDSDYKKLIWIISALGLLAVVILYNSSKSEKTETNVSNETPITSVDTVKNTVSTLTLNDSTGSEFLIRYDTSKISEQLLNNAFNFIVHRQNYEGAYMDISFDRIYDSSEAKNICEEEEIKYNELVDKIDNVSLPQSAIFDKLKKEELNYISNFRTCRRIEMYYYYDMTKFANVAIKDQQTREYRDALVAGGDELLNAWRNWFTQEAANSGNPDEFLHEHMEVYNSDNALESATIEFFSSAFNNSMVSAYTVTSYTNYRESHSDNEIFVEAIKPFVISVDVNGDTKLIDQ
jgi:hypothetical protein